MASIYANPLRPFEPKGRALMDIHPQDDGTDDDNLASSILCTTPKLSSKAPQNTIKSDEIYTIRQVDVGEEELFARGRCVYWTRNSLIIKSFNFTEQVTKLFWSKFRNSDHVCIALLTNLNIFNMTGQHFQVPLPFTFRNIHPTNLGLIIERNCDFPDENKFPTLFSLTHPSKEVAPILFKQAKRGTTEGSLDTSLPTSAIVAACHDTLGLCLIYDSDDGHHSIYKIRHTLNDEIDKFQQMNHDESTINTFTHHHSSSYREGTSQQSLSLTSKQRSSLIQTNQSSNFSPKIDARGKQSIMGSLAVSRLGLGAALTQSDGNSTTIRSFSSLSAKNLMSTPNKSRLINYLRDTIAEPILPEITFEQVWTDTSSIPKEATKFFSTSDFSHNRYLVMVLSAVSQVKLMKFESSVGSKNDFSLARAHHITAIDAMPVAKMHMMIVIDTNKEFVLYSGQDRIAQVVVPQPSTTTLRMPTSSSPFSKHSIEMTPYQQTSSARKRSSVGGRSSVCSDSSIHQMFQALSPVPHPRLEGKTSTPLNTTDNRRLDYVVGQSVLLTSSNDQRARFEIPSICQTSCISKLIKAMMIAVPKDLRIFILSNWYQTRRSTSGQEFLHAREELKLFKNWILNSIGVTSNFFEDSFSVNNIELSMKLVTLSPNKKSRRTREVDSNPIVANIYAMFYAMHIVFEDMLLVKLNYERSCDLAELLIVLACLLKLPAYQEYYWLKFPFLQDKFGSQKSSLENLIPKVELSYKPPFFQDQPPSVMEFIREIIYRSQYGTDYCGRCMVPFPRLVDVTDDSNTVISLFCEMFNTDKSKAIVSISSSNSSYPASFEPGKVHRSCGADRRLVELMVQMGKTRNYISKLPEGLNLYLWDAILNCRESPPRSWSESCFEVVGRMDLVNLSRNRTKIESKDDEEDLVNLIFPDDIRVMETFRMLMSNLPLEFSYTHRQGATEEESRDEVHRQLYLLNVRTMAMPLGRGAVSLRTYSPVIGESFEVPRLELSGRALTEDRTIEYNHDVSVYPWPFFHNGVAAGLTICASTANNIIDSTWINYNRPRSNMPQNSDIRDRDFTNATINSEHAGFLFALGLNGHLEKLSIMALHDYLCQNNDLTKLAILLGMSAAKRGSRDNHMIKVLSIHVDALLPPNSTELDVPATVHTASILGVGLLYQGSGDSHLSKVLLEEIGRLPGPESNSHVDRESYSLSAGLAFGLINLCKGGSSTISSSDDLRLYMLGGRRKPLTNAQKERYFKQDCHRGEEEYINAHVTSPGGTLGLGLMYHRSGNESVANWMRAPDTQTCLEHVRPDFLTLRMLNYGLIMWDKIKPSEEYIESHIPKIVSSNAFSIPSNTKIDYELMSQAYCNIVAGCCMAIAMRYAGTANHDAYKTIYKHTKMLINLSNKPSLVEQAGKPCVEACLNVLVTSLAVVMAGTGDLGVMRVCRYLRSRLTHSCVFYGSYMAVHMALGILFLGSCRYSLNTSPESIGALVCALYPIYPNHSSDNRYHLQALRHLYVLAAEPRLLIPRDILTDKPVYAIVTVKHKLDNGDIVKLNMKAPCLMPEVDSILSICVNDDRYWSIEITSKETLVNCLYSNRGSLSVRRRVKEDQFELDYALKDLAKIKSKDDRFQLLYLEQLQLASTLNERTDKVHSLKSIVGEHEAELSKNRKIHGEWLSYIAQETDWTNTNPRVVSYIISNDLKCFDVDDEFLKAVKQLDI